MYVNCQPIGEKPLDVVDSRIDLNGEIVVAKNAETSRTFPIDLQWMVMTCDPQSVERETCDELPVSDNNNKKNPFKIHNCNNYFTLNIFLVFYYFYSQGKNLRSLHVQLHVHLDQLENLVSLEHLEQLEPLEKEDRLEELVHPENQGKLVFLECLVIL